MVSLILTIFYGIFFGLHYSPSEKMHNSSPPQQQRLEEWKVDVPTIGAIYSNPDRDSLYGGGRIVIFLNGLGRPFRGEGWTSERHWLRRAWTLQETPVVSRCLIAGLPEGPNYQWDHLDSGINSGSIWLSLWPWNCKVCKKFLIYSLAAYTITKL